MLARAHTAGVNSVRSVTPAPAAMSAALVPWKPRSANSLRAEASSSRRVRSLCSCHRSAFREDRQPGRPSQKAHWWAAANWADVSGAVASGISSWMSGRAAVKRGQ
jgi:hypothetical protein